MVTQTRDEPENLAELLARAEQWEAAGRFDEAAELLAGALHFHPHDPELIVRLGFASLRIGDRVRAKMLAQSALRDNPESLSARKLLSAVLLRGDSYLAVLEQLHALRKPRTYIEIGVWEGRSLRLAQPGTTAIGVDPNPRLASDLPDHIRLVRETSDEFFARRNARAELGGQAVELSFIDGMHQFEFALRDFMNLEACSAENALILLHDCYPLDALSAGPTPPPETDFWTGDVWRTVVALRRHRPDLEVVTLACPPSGLGLVRNLDPGSRVLRERYEQIVEEMQAYDFAAFEPSRDRELNVVDGSWRSIVPLLEGPAGI
jgi:tetratricopeptide (TPR) repeat protein